MHLQQRDAARAKARQRKHALKSALLLALVASASAIVLRASSLVYNYGERGLPMFGKEVIATATQFSQRANAASNSFNARVVAVLEQAQSHVVARDLAMASAVANVGQEVATVPTGIVAMVGGEQEPAKANPPESSKLATNSSPTQAKEDAARTSAETKPEDIPTKSEPTSTTTTTVDTAALPAFRSKSSPPAQLQYYATGGYAYGQCTYYVASRRPTGARWGNARDWMAHAKAEGWLTGNIPVPGAIAWTPAGWYGHVAYVERIEGNSVLISEMNFAGWNRVSQRWVPATSFGYIYGKPQ